MPRPLRQDDLALDFWFTRYFRGKLSRHDDLDRVADPLGQLLSRWMAMEKPNEFWGVGGIRTNLRHPR